MKQKQTMSIFDRKTQNEHVETFEQEPKFQGYTPVGKPYYASDQQLREQQITKKRQKLTDWKNDNKRTF